MSKHRSITGIKEFLDASIANVVETLFVAILLVVSVVYLFLHDLRATLIPSLALVVSLVGTFAFLSVVGYSLNLLTLLALVLVIPSHGRYKSCHHSRFYRSDDFGLWLCGRL